MQGVEHAFLKVNPCMRGKNTPQHLLPELLYTVIMIEFTCGGTLKKSWLNYMNFSDA